jgi:hypothetical protein
MLQMLTFEPGWGHSAGIVNDIGDRETPQLGTFERDLGEDWRGDWDFQCWGWGKGIVSVLMLSNLELRNYKSRLNLGGKEVFLV